MKLECSRKDLHEALNLASMATSVRTSLPILQTLRLEASGTTLRVTGCDGEMWADRQLLANVEAPGGVCVSAGFIKEVVANMPEGQISFELDGASMYLRGSMSEWKMMVFPVEEFPEPPEVAAKSELRLPMGLFRASLDNVTYALADDNTRPLLTGVLFIYDGSVLTFVATDTHRMAVNRLERPGIGSELNAIVPGKALKAVRSLPLSDEDEVTVVFDETRLAVDSGTCKIVSQLLIGTYPNWERVVPQEHTRSWIADRVEMLDNVKRAMIIAKDTANRVRFMGHGDQVQISARSEEKGEAKEEIAVVGKNGDVEIAFNGRFVEDALRALKGDGVRIELTEPTRPAVFRPTEDEHQTFCVIMPMALA